MLKYKAEFHGKVFVKADEYFPSSQICCYCGYRKEDLKLSDRVWQCPRCNVTHDRDLNASVNLFRHGINKFRVGLERSEFTPGEIGPLSLYHYCNRGISSIGEPGSSIYNFLLFQ